MGLECCAESVYVRSVLSKNRPDSDSGLGSNVDSNASADYFAQRNLPDDKDEPIEPSKDFLKQLPQTSLSQLPME